LKKKALTPLDKIYGLKEQLVGKEGAGGFYSRLRTEQTTDQKFYDDEFPTVIKEPYRVSRTGASARIVDTACDSVDISNPQVFCEAKKPTEIEQRKAAKRARYLNHRVALLWEEIEEHKKNNMQRGEAYYQIEYNLDFDPNDENSLPTLITAPDPMIIYPDPHEVKGVPRRVIKSCRMNVGQVEQLFPDWSNPDKKQPNSDKGVDYLAYWDTGTRYAEADKEPVLGLQPNIFGFVPFVHCYSGFGKRSPEGKPETKVVGRLRKIRDIIVEQCETQSRINSQIALFTDPVILIEPDPNWAGQTPKLPKDIEQTLRFVPGGVITGIPGWKITIFQGAVPGPQMYNHLYQINAQLGLEVPNVALGLPSTARATGRQENIYVEEYRRKYKTFINNEAKALATALSMDLRIVEWRLKEFPKGTKITVKAKELKDGKEVVKEELLTAEDIDGCYDCRVVFKEEDTTAQDREFTKYERLAGQGRASWKSLLVKGMGYTEDEAEEEINEALAEQAWRTNPELMAMVLTEALERAGQHSLLRKMKEEAQRAQQMAQIQPQAQTQAPRPSEARNPLASDILRQSLAETPVGTRRTPGGV
jgi:hypothetical protein